MKYFERLQMLENMDEEWKNAAWIGAETNVAPYLRKAFVLPKKVKKARIYVTGLGLYTLYLNGEKVGNGVLEQAVSQYHKRYFYSVYDVTDALQKENAIGVILGRGYYAILPNGRDWQVDNWAHAPWRDERKLRLQLRLEYEDGEEIIGTDESWKYAESPILFDEPHYGEVYDARKEIAGWNVSNFDDSTWKNAVLRNAPQGKAEPTTIPAIKVAESITPIEKNCVGENRFVFDMGKVTSGWCALQVQGKRGGEVKIRYSERAFAVGNLDRAWRLEDSLFDGVLREGQTDYYILKGEGVESFEPRFTYKGFRFVEVTLPSETTLLSVEGKAVHTAVESVGKFVCSNEKINRIHELCRQSLLNNYHGYPSDTPVYEKLGYLADGFITQDAAAYNFDVASFYEKWAVDIRLQVKENGYVEQTAPMWDEEKENAPEWSLAMIFCPWQHYLFYGDCKILRDNYVAMQKVFAYQLSLEKNGEFSSMWGDHGGDLRRLSPSAHMYAAACVLAEISALIQDGKRGEYLQTAGKIKQNFERIFFDEKAGYYREEEGVFHLNAQILPLAFGITPTERKAALWAIIQEKAKELQSLDCGILSLKYLFPMLAERGYIDLALRMILDEKYHSYGYLLSLGATTLWEFWNENSRSYDHHMYAAVDEFFYGELSGIRREGVGFATLRFKPYLTQEITWCEGEIETPRGKARSAWKNGERAFVWEITVPANTTAAVYIPLQGENEVLESGKPIAQAEGVLSVEKEKDYLVCKVGAGNYAFTQTKGACTR